MECCLGSGRDLTKKDIVDWITVVTCDCLLTTVTASTPFKVVFPMSQMMLDL